MTGKKQTYDDCCPFQGSYDELRGKRTGSAWPKQQGVDSNSFIGIFRKRVESDGVDLPTSAQWECMCRAGSDTDFYNGENLNEDEGRNLEILRKLGSIDAVTSVGQHEPNAWGFYNCLGGMGEWCLDCFVGPEPVVIERGDDIEDDYGTLLAQHCVDPYGWSGNKDTESSLRTIRGNGLDCSSAEQLTSWYSGGENSSHPYGGARMAWNWPCLGLGEWSVADDEKLKNEFPSQEITVLRQCSLHGDLVADLILARCRFLGAGGVARNYDEGVSQLKNLSTLGLPSAMTRTASILLEESRQTGDKDKRREAMNLYLHAIQARDFGALRGYIRDFRMGKDSSA